MKRLSHFPYWKKNLNIQIFGRSFIIFFWNVRALMKMEELYEPPFLTELFIHAHDQYHNAYIRNVLKKWFDWIFWIKIWKIMRVTTAKNNWKDFRIRFIYLIFIFIFIQTISYICVSKHTHLGANAQNNWWISIAKAKFSKRFVVWCCNLTSAYLCMNTVFDI